MRTKDGRHTESDVRTSISGGVFGPVKEQRTGEDVLVPRALQRVAADLRGKLSRRVLIGPDLRSIRSRVAVDESVRHLVTAEDDNSQHRGEAWRSRGPSRRSIRGRLCDRRLDPAWRLPEPVDDIEEEERRAEKQTTTDDVIAHLRLVLQRRDMQRNDVIQNEPAESSEVEDIPQHERTSETDRRTPRSER